MISDFVKGKQKFNYPAAILNGIDLHRMIDRFTDEHAATREAKEVFRPVYRLYSGAFVDVVYDHFLATDPAEFSENSLLTFSLETYRQLDQQQVWMPERFAYMYPYMKDHNWLFNYRTMEGASKSLSGVVRRSAYLTESDSAIKLFRQHYQLLQGAYRQFWTDMKKYALAQFELFLLSL